MLKVNEKYDVKIESVNNLGNGVARIDGIAVFVPYTVEGDFCRVKIAKVYSSYAIAALESVLAPSSFRVNPQCPYFYECGGCSYLNCTLDAENLSKESYVSGILKKFGIRAETDKIVCPVSEKYRNKVLLFYGNGGFGYFKQGFFTPLFLL